MKKLLTLIFGALIALSLFVTTGNTAKAAKPVDDCGCTGLLVGAEKNKLVAELLSSQEFKTVKAELTSAGYSYKGASLIEVGKMNGAIISVVPFYTKDGQTIIAGFVNGVFQGTVNPETEEPVEPELSPPGNETQVQSILAIM